MRHDVTQQDDYHEFASVWQGHVTGSEEAQNGVEEQQADCHEQESDDEIQRHRIAQQVLGGLVVALSQLDRDTG